MRSYWIREGPKFNDWYPMRSSEDTGTRRGEGCVTIETETV